jgi:hypothetical protein
MRSGEKLQHVEMETVTSKRKKNDLVENSSLTHFSEVLSGRLGITGDM